MVNKSRVILALIAVWVCVIFSFSLHNAQSSHSQSAAVKKAVTSVLRQENIKPSRNIYDIYSPLLQKGETASGEFFVRKTAHTFEYAVLGLLCSLWALRRPRRRQRLPMLLLGPAVAFVDELVVQRFFSAGRTASLADVLLDTLGFVLACLLFLLVTALHKALLKRRRQA